MQRTRWQKNRISETQGSPDGMPTTNLQLGELRVIIGKEAAILGGRRTDLARHKAQQMEFQPVQLGELRVIVGEKEAGDTW